MRRGSNLLSLTDLFEAFEFDLRRNPKLQELFATYDQLLEQFVRTLPLMQQLYGKMMLNAVTLLALTEKTYTLEEIADSVMLYDDSSPAMFQQSLQSIMETMATAAGNSLTIESTELGKRYQLFLAKPQEAKASNPLDPLLNDISDNDGRLIELLLNAGKNYFKDWPLGYEEQSGAFTRRAELELYWRGTARRGVIKLGGPCELHTEDPASLNKEWQITLVSPLSLTQNRESVPTTTPLYYWYPQQLQSDDLLELKRLLILTQQGQMLFNFGDLENHLTDSQIRVSQIFQRCYLQGQLDGAQLQTGQALPALENLPERRLNYFLGSIFSEHLRQHYPQHPNFGDLLNERTLKVLVRGFFYPADWQRPEMQKYLGQFVLPLNLVTGVGEKFDFATLQDIMPNTPLAALFTLLDSSQTRTIDRAQLEEYLRQPPFGMQPPVILLLVLGAAAAGYITLTNSSGQTILNHIGIRSGYDISQYANIRLAIARSENSQEFLGKLITGASFSQPLEQVFEEA
jgi:hypothetical protein